MSTGWLGRRWGHTEGSIVARHEVSVSAKSAPVCLTGLRHSGRGCRRSWADSKTG